MTGRAAWAEVDPEAISANIGLLAATVAPSAVWAVVKADGYGHGAVTAARAALAGGATGLCVALVQEGIELRRAGVGDVPLLVLSPQPVGQFGGLVAHGLTPTLTTAADVARFADAVRAGHRSHVGVHLKFDTGMHRVGAAPEDAVALAGAVLGEAPALRLAGVFTHLAMADEPTDPFTELQLDRFDTVLAALAAAGIDPGLVHAANSAGALAHPRARRDLVRVGIAGYGIEPGPGVHDRCTALRPALRLVARVSSLKRVAAGERISYGLRYRFDVDSLVATVPIGYADGVPRRLFETRGEVLIGGRRRRIAGVVTMDQLMVDCGPADAMDAATVAAGDDVVLLGSQGDETVRAEEWAERLSTIPYEIVCGISRRIERRTGSGSDR